VADGKTKLRNGSETSCFNSRITLPCAANPGKVQRKNSLLTSVF